MIENPAKLRQHFFVFRAKGERVPIPSLTDRGVLPLNIHSCTLDEVEHEFGTNNPHTRRADLWSKFVTFIEGVRGIGVFPSVYIDGSFTTDKGRSSTILPSADPPGDIDAVLELPPPSPAVANVLSNAANLRLLNKDYVRTTFEIHLFFYWPGIPPNNDFVDFFQRVKRDEALDRGLPVGSRKGILKVQL